MAQRSDNDWIHRARVRGLGNFLSVALDILEPLGPLGAQFIFIAQPALGLLVGRDTLSALANALESPGGVEALRRQLEDDASPST